MGIGLGAGLWVAAMGFTFGCEAEMARVKCVAAYLTNFVAH